jgi:signal transduction histidine kinase
VFERFVQGAAEPMRGNRGLGLAFCKLAVDAHGGRIWVQSAGEGKGSSFHIALPTKPAHRRVRVTASGAVPA